MIYTTGWARKKLKTEAQYQEWLASLKPQDEVVLQSFMPPQSILGMPFERWRFQKGRVIFNNEKLYQFVARGDDAPLRPDGMACYWNSDRPWGEVFPARLIPMHYDLEMNDKEEGFWLTGHAPVYEPLFFGNYRHVFFVPHGKDVYKRRNSVRNLYPYCYETDVEGGTVITAFGPDEFNAKLEGVRYCYSQYLSA